MSYHLLIRGTTCSFPPVHNRDWEGKCGAIVLDACSVSSWLNPLLVEKNAFRILLHLFLNAAFTCHKAKGCIYSSRYVPGPRSLLKQEARVMHFRHCYIVG